MITKKIINSQIEKAVNGGKQPLNAVQEVFENLVAEYSLESNKDKAQVLNAILHYAYEMLKSEELIGYKSFDLIFGRAFSTSKKLRYIQEQEGKNLFD